MTRATLIALCSTLALATASTASAADGCAKTVIADWMDGRVDGRYAPACYGQALEQLPEDVRVYTTAVEDISRALRERIRATRPADERGGPTESSDPVVSVSETATPSESLPAPLLWSAAVAALLALAASASLVTRRLRRFRLAHRGPRPVGQW
jgi:hypothetical protein